MPLFFIAGPSEKYWEVISERRRKALLEALEEHQRLQALAMALEEENLSLGVSVDNTTHIVNILKVNIFHGILNLVYYEVNKWLVLLLMMYGNENIIIIL